MRIALVDEILTLNEVAHYPKLAENTAYRLAADGKIPGFKVGGSWGFRQQDIEQCISEKKADTNLRDQSLRSRSAKDED